MTVENRMINLATREGYDVATAMRGPDFDDDYLKEATAAVIRYKVGIPNSNEFGCLSNPDTEVFAEYRKSLGELKENWVGGLYFSGYEGSKQHYLLHSYRAFVALGLKWEEVNL